MSKFIAHYNCTHLQARYELTAETPRKRLNSLSPNITQTTMILVSYLMTPSTRR